MNKPHSQWSLVHVLESVENQNQRFLISGLTWNPRQCFKETIYEIASNMLEWNFWMFSCLLNVCGERYFPAFEWLVALRWVAHRLVAQLPVAQELVDHCDIRTDSYTLPATWSGLHFLRSLHRQSECNANGKCCSTIVPETSDKDQAPREENMHLRMYRTTLQVNC